jgi:Glutathione synthase/Ribosomal protein S6 modification enzyme (glutaminyl transferase)
MKLWLIYSTEGYRRNESYAKLYVKYFARRGILLEIFLTEKLSFSRGEWYYGGVKVTLPAAAVVRTINPNLSLLLEREGVRVFNSARVSQICNNKYLTHRLAVENGLPVMETKLVSAGYGGALPMDFPFIMKSLDGHGGKEVFYIENEEIYHETLQFFIHRPYIVQRVAQTLGKDLRVYVLGGKIIAGMMRTAVKGFKSNYTSGGIAEKISLTPEVKAIVKKVYEVLSADFIGVDFVFDGGKPVLNEIEDVVGSRMLYAIDVDAASLYVDYIVSELLTEN